MTKVIALISCSFRKLHRAAPARELYTSPLFRFSLEHARTLAADDSIHVVSALWGLVDLDQPIEPYNLKLSSHTQAERNAWGMRVADSIVRKHGERIHVVALAGELYVKPIAEALWLINEAIDVSEPLAGLQIGERLKYLRAASMVRRGVATPSARVIGARQDRPARHREAGAAKMVKVNVYAIGGGK